MNYSVQVTDAGLSLEDLELTIQQLEQQDFTLISLAAGRVDNQRANIVTLAFATTADTVTLHQVGQALSEQEQADALDGLASETGGLISFGEAWVQHALVNVAAVRNR